MAFGGFSSFGQDAGPIRPKPFNSSTSFTSQPPPVSPPFPNANPQRSPRPALSSLAWGNEPRSLVSYAGLDDHSQASPASPYMDSYKTGGEFPTEVTDIRYQKRTRSPPVSSHVNFQNNSHFARSHTQLSSITPHVDSYDSGRNFPTELSDVRYPKRTRSPTVSSPNDIFEGNTHFAGNDLKRPYISPPRLGSRSDVPLHITDPQIQRSSLSANKIDAEATATKPSSFPVLKRSKSPPVSFQFSKENSYSIQDGTEREMQAKAKRLARFKVELDQTMSSSPDVVNQNISGNRNERPWVEKRKYVGEQSVEMEGDFPNLSENADLESSSIITGFCPDMCPESERAERERKGDLDQYERLDGDRNQTSRSLAVKKYTRTAEREAGLIRPMPILQKTIDYLLNLLDQPYDKRFLGMYNFLWDRMRAIRMDLRMQHIFNLEAITMLEQMIRLHIIAMHELCECTKGEGFSEGFDAHLNIEQMNKTSVELFQMYDDHRKKGINVPTEKEFRGYYALLKLDKHPGYKVEPAELSLDLAKMTPETRQTAEVLFARDVARACRTNNFITFFRLAKKASYLQACLMHAHFAKLRTTALASLHCGLQNNQGIPVAHVAKWLGMEEEDIESLLEFHGFLIKEFEEPYMVKEGPFINGEKDYFTRCSKLVHLKKSRRIMEDILHSCQAVSFPAEKAKELQLGKVHKQEPTADQVVKTVSSVHILDDEMPDFESQTAKVGLFQLSQNDGLQVQPILKTSLPGQHRGVGHQAAGVRLSPRSFSMAHNSPESQAADILSVQKPQFEAPFRSSQDRSVSQEGFSPIHNFPGSQAAEVVRVQIPDSEASFRNSLYKNAHHEMEAAPLQFATEGVCQETSAVHTDSAMENSVPQNVVTEDLEREKCGDIHQKAENDQLRENYRDIEVAEAKLKLILRIWRRRSSKLKELREQRLLSANAALSSLSLGPPIRQKKNERRTSGEFNIDRVMRERYEKHEQSWSKLNVSDVIASQLSKRNPEAKCLCFKLIVCSQSNSPGDRAGDAEGSWLVSKLMPTRNNDDDLVILSSGMSIWKKWVPGQAGSNLTCCLSVIKDVVKLGNLNEAVLGASAVLFLVSGTIPWELQKIQLHNILMSLPSGSNLPLLLLSGSFREQPSDPAATIANKLGLNQLDKLGISSWSIVPLVGNQQTEFFSDEKLREGLQWLASESPLQPVLHIVKTRELVLTHLNSSLKVLDERSIYEVSPDHCISAFNESLEKSFGEVTDAASACLSSWPCPEISLLDQSSIEHRAAELYLPSIGWNSATRIKPLMCALRDCKLPTFSEDVSWLGQGANTREDIENQKSGLENCLIRYLTESSNTMGLALARNEACVMVQKNTQLKLYKSSFYIVPEWVMIFQRIFNWRLTSLSSGDSSEAYVLVQHSIPQSFECCISPSCNILQPSLDEMIEVSCSPILSKKCRLAVESFPSVRRMVLGDNEGLEDNNTRESMEERRMVLNHKERFKDSNTHELMEEERDLVVDGDWSCFSNGLNLVSRGEDLVDSVLGKRNKELNKLFEQCYAMLDSTDKKLSIYFP